MFPNHFYLRSVFLALFGFGLLALACGEAPTPTPQLLKTATKPPAIISTSTIKEPTASSMPTVPMATRTAVVIPTKAPTQVIATIAIPPKIAPTIALVLPTATVVIIPTTQAPAPISGYVCPGGDRCIKGNISSDGGKIYHFPGCASYNQTKIDESKGERLFATAAEAEAAGWRKAQNCP